MKMFALALVSVLGVVGFVMADSFNADLHKVDGNKITAAKVVKAGKKGAAGKKGGKKGGKADPPPPQPAIEYELAKGCVIGKGYVVVPAFTAHLEGLAFPDGLKNEAFKDVSANKTVRVHITTADEDKGDVKKGQVTQILVVP